MEKAQLGAGFEINIGNPGMPQSQNVHHI